MADYDDRSYALVNFKPFTGNPAQRLINAIVIAKGKIERVGNAADIASGIKQIDLQKLNLSPGFIDLQLNGCGGVLFNDDISTKTLDIMHETNLRQGCTTFLPTLITCDDDDIIQAIVVVHEYKALYPNRVPGLHLEGPYLNVKRKGIHNQDYIRTPTKAMINFFCENSDVISMITLAPEVCPEGVIEQLSDAGITVSIGHTDATCAEVIKAEKAGATFATHLHNAMRPLGSREPGVVGAIFDSQVLGAGIIADGHHLAWENLRIAWRLLQDRLVLVSDATTPTGTDMSTFGFAGQTIHHRSGKCTNADGTLAGSALTMMASVANSINAGIQPQAVIRMASINAAKAINVQDKMGTIEVGKYANIAIFDDNFILKGSVDGGELRLYSGENL